MPNYGGCARKRARFPGFSAGSTCGRRPAWRIPYADRRLPRDAICADPLYIVARGDFARRPRGHTDEHVEFDKMRDMAHFPPLAQGSDYRRSHGWQTYVFDNGALRIFSGVTPSSSLQRRAEFAPYIERCLWCIDRNCSIRDELETYAELDHRFAQ